MDITAEVTLPTIGIPCPNLPELGPLPKIPLLGGAELTAFLNFAEGSMTDCKLHFNLLLQLGPLFASMGCLLKILGVFKLIPDFLGAVTQPWKLPSIVPNIITAITDLLKCFPPLAILDVIAMIMAIIRLIIKFISCLIEQIMSVINILSNIDISIAFGNGPLTTSLGCAQDTANNLFTNLMAAVEIILPIIAIIQMLIGMVGGAVTIPAMPDVKRLMAAQTPEEALGIAQELTDGFNAILASLETQQTAAQAAAAAAASADITEIV